MREIRRKNPHIKDTDSMGALDDVNEQELAKDGAGEGVLGQNTERIEDTAVTAQTIEQEHETDNTPLPLSIDKKEEQVIVSPRSGKSREKGQEQRERHSDETVEAKMSEEREKAPKKRKTNAYYIAFIVVCALLSGAVVLFAVLDKPDALPPDGDGDLLVQTPPTDSNENKSDASLYDRISSVAVTVRARGENGTKIGSGTVVFSEGYVAALWDTVDGAESIEIMLKGGDSYAARLIGGSALTELALLKIDGAELVGIKAADGAEIGDDVYAVGAVGSSSVAALSSSLCKGSIAYGARTLRVDEGKSQKFIRAIQLDGFDSETLGGCPVFNASGETIGIMVNIGSDEASFALPIREVMSLLTSLRDGETPEEQTVGAIAYPCPRLGAECETVDGGVLIKYLYPETDAARKLKEGDVIVKVGEVGICDIEALLEQIEKHRVGDKVEIFVERYTQILSFYVKLGE